MTTPKNISTAHPTKWRLVFPFLNFLTDKEKGDDLILFCSEVQLPGITLDTILVETPYYEQKEASNKISFDDLIITYSIDEKYDNYKLLLDWLLYIKSPLNYEIRNQKVTASLFTYTNNENPSTEFVLHNIFPISIEPINFDSKVEDSEDIPHTVSFAIEYFTIRE